MLEKKTLSIDYFILLVVKIKFEFYGCSSFIALFASFTASILI